METRLTPSGRFGQFSKNSVARYSGRLRENILLDHLKIHFSVLFHFFINYPNRKIPWSIVFYSQVRLVDGASVAFFLFSCLGYPIVAGFRIYLKALFTKFPRRNHSHKICIENGMNRYDAVFYLGPNFCKNMRFWGTFLDKIGLILELRDVKICSSFFW